MSNTNTNTNTNEDSPGNYLVAHNPLPFSDEDKAILGKAADILLKAELSREGATIFNEPSKSCQFLFCKLQPQRDETFAVIFMDNKCKLIAYEELFSGSVNKATVHPRVVVRRCLELNAAAVIFAHNHPSGVAEPSREDQTITTRLRDLLEPLDIRVLDHIVVGDGVTVSMADRGLI